MNMSNWVEGSTITHECDNSFNAKTRTNAIKLPDQSSIEFLCVFYVKIHCFNNIISIIVIIYVYEVLYRHAVIGFEIIDILHCLTG